MSQQLFDWSVNLDTYQELRWYILCNSGNADDVYDILHEGWSELFKKGHEKDLKDKKQIGAYLTATCKNMWLEELKRRKKTLPTDNFEDEEDNSGDNLREDEKKEALWGILLRCLKKLPEKCQELLQMKMEGCSCKEIALYLGYNNSQVSRNKTCSCIKRLRYLARQDPEYIKLFGSG